MGLRLSSASQILAARTALGNHLKGKHEGCGIRAKVCALSSEWISVAEWALNVETQRGNNVIIRSLTDENGRLVEGWDVWGTLQVLCRVVQKERDPRSWLDSTGLPSWKSLGTRGWMLWRVNYSCGGERGVIRGPRGQIDGTWRSTLWVLQKYARFVRVTTGTYASLQQNGKFLKSLSRGHWSEKTRSRGILHRVRNFCQVIGKKVGGCRGETCRGSANLCYPRQVNSW